jgi:hypothetical protein
MTRVVSRRRFAELLACRRHPQFAEESRTNYRFSTFRSMLQDDAFVATEALLRVRNGSPPPQRPWPNRMALKGRFGRSASRLSKAASLASCLSVVFDDTRQLVIGSVVTIQPRLRARDVWPNRRVDEAHLFDEAARRSQCITPCSATRKPSAWRGRAPCESGESVTIRGQRWD